MRARNCRKIEGWYSWGWETWVVVYCGSQLSSEERSFFASPADLSKFWGGTQMCCWETVLFFRMNVDQMHPLLGLGGGAETWSTGLGLRSFFPPKKKSPWNEGISVCQQPVLCLAQRNHIFSCGDSNDWIMTLDCCSQGRCAASSMAWQRGN